MTVTNQHLHFLNTSAGRAKRETYVHALLVLLATLAAPDPQQHLLEGLRFALWDVSSVHVACGNGAGGSDSGLGASVREGGGESGQVGVLDSRLERVVGLEALSELDGGVVLGVEGGVGEGCGGEEAGEEGDSLHVGNGVGVWKGLEVEYVAVEVERVECGGQKVGSS